MPKQVSRSPKRRIERIHSSGTYTELTSVINRVLYTAEDKKTLIRIKGRINQQPLASFAGDIEQKTKFTLSVKPAGVAIKTPVLNELEQPVNVNTLLQSVLSSSMNDGSGAMTKDIIEIDSKAMRKLNVGDEINLASLANTDMASGIAFSFDMWFKE